MTEEEWLAEDANHWPRLNCAIQKTVNSRKLILAAVSFCYPAMYLMKDERSKDAVIAAEKYADGEISREEILKAIQAAYAAEYAAHAAFAAANVAYAATLYYFTHAASATAQAAAYATDTSYVHYAAYYTANTANIHAPDNSKFGQCMLIRCIFGNPFRIQPIVCVNETIQKMAQQIYTEKRFEHLPLLADLLEEAGCVAVDVLAHCRQDVPHARGCWVLDTVLGKE
jgi:hypothetical protein